MRHAVLLAAAMLMAAPLHAAHAAQKESWIPTWYAAPEPSASDAQLTNTTLRQIVRVSAGGNKVRLRLSNAYGRDPLKLDAIHIARRETGNRIDTATDTAVTFGGRTGVSIAPGAYVLSDPIALTVSDHADLAVSLYAAGTVPLTTVHDIQRAILYAAPGNAASAAELSPAADFGIGRAAPWISEVEVSGADEKAALVAFGDSITDGFGITPDSGGTWPHILSRRLDDAKIPLSVINAGISGNRLLNHGTWARFGTGGLARFDRDVLAQPNVAGVIILLGINDLGHAQGPGSAQYATAEDMIEGLRQVVDRARARGLRVYAGTLLPFKDTVFNGYYSDEKETRRLAINAWIRTSGAFDGVFDFDKATEDPARPGYLLPAYDVGDHLHPNDAGAKAMADAIPVEAFKWAKKLK